MGGNGGARVTGNWVWHCRMIFRKVLILMCFTTVKVESVTSAKNTVLIVCPPPREMMNQNSFIVAALENSYQAARGNKRPSLCNQ